jgi:hypothetical protein
VLTALVVAIIIGLAIAILSAIMVALGLKPKRVVPQEAHDPLAIGVYTGIEDYAEDGCRTIEWSTLDTTWEEFGMALDRFLEHAVKTTAEVYADRPVPWLVLRYEPPAGSLTVQPSDSEVPDYKEEPRVQLHLHSQFLEGQYGQPRAGGDSELAREVWSFLSGSLSNGPVAAAVTEARVLHPMRLAGYDYHSGSDLGPSRLSENGELT